MLLVKFFIVSNLIINNNFINEHLIKVSSENYILSHISMINKSSKIGIVDFRKILRNSIAMKNLGKIFIDAEKKINQKLNMKHIELKKIEKNILKKKNTLSNSEYQKKIKLFKNQVFKVQNYDKEQRASLSKSFQKIQKQLKDKLANIVKDISIKKKINIVLLKDNVFIFNDINIDLTSEALNSFNEKTRSMSIEIIVPK